MALARASFGLGSTVTHQGPFNSPAELRVYYYGTGDGIHWIYPGGLISRLPDNADWLPNITGIGGQGQIQGFVGPIITTPGVAANGGQGYAYDANGNMLFWNANGKLVTQNDLPASSGAVPRASSLADAYNPSSPHFGLDIQYPVSQGGGLQQFDPVQAVSVRGRMANLGEDQATAEARAAAASKILGVAVQPLLVTASPPPPPPSYATPPGVTLPVNVPSSSGSSTTHGTTYTPPPPTIASVAATTTTTPQTAGIAGIAAILLGGGLLFAFYKSKH